MQRGIQVVVPDDLTPGSNWSDWISRKIGEVDIVIGVLTSERRSQWVLFELGQAAALGRQIVLIAPPKFGAVPSHLKSFLILRASPKNRDAIEFALDQILASPERPYVSQPTPPLAEPALGHRADQSIQYLRNALSTNDYRGLERVVADALRHSGAEIVSEASAAGEQRQADIAIWSDALQPFVGNPFLIEVKSRFRGISELRAAANQLFAAIVSRGGNWGLLLYGEGPEDLAEKAKGLPPTILVSSVGDLFEQLRFQSFPEVIRDLRNRRVHGRER